MIPIIVLIAVKELKDIHHCLEADLNKSLKILSNRPDSKRIKKIAFIKQFLNQSRINPKSSLRRISKNLYS